MITDIVLGLLDNSESIDDPAISAKYRDFTVWWTRYEYRGTIIERPSVRAILDEARARGHRYCFILSYGQLISEHWAPDSAGRQDFFSALASWIENHDFLVAGLILDGGDAWFGLAPRCLLVDLERYASTAGAPPDCTSSRSIELPQPSAVRDGERITELRPSGRSGLARPSSPSWDLVAASLEAGIPVVGIDPDLLARTLDLEPRNRPRTQALARYFGPGIAEYVPDGSGELSADQSAFLDVIALQTGNARHGVFLWNIEGYEDVETPPVEFTGPVSTLYSVAAGFKPYKILQTHGFDRSTRVVFFDYSPNALKIKERMIREWGGEDFPRYARYLFEEFPHPETFYQLWSDASPDELDWDVMTSRWERELERWGGQQAFTQHWNACRELDHQFVHCDVLQDPWKLVQRVRTERRAVIWWSNAFFTMCSNWFHDVDARRIMYEQFAEQMAATSPETLLYGSDYNNVNVNGISAGEYWVRYRNGPRSALEPCRLYRRVIRM